MEQETVCHFGDNREYSYNKTDFIGVGNFGIVYRATATDTAGNTETVALKEVRISREQQNNNIRTISAAWEVLIGLEHQNLVRYYQISLRQESECGYGRIAMSYCPDGDLAQLMGHFQRSGRKMPLKMFLDYAQQMATALAFLHENAIFNPDVKPSNLLVTPPIANVNMLKMCDLDDVVVLQRDVTCSQNISHLCRTARYMSPEMVKRFGGGRHTDPIGRKSNIWSAGCVIQELALCCIGEKETWLQSPDGEKRLECHKLSSTAIMVKIVDGYVPYVGEPIPKDLARRVMKGCFAIIPGDRFTAAELNNQLVEIQQETYGSTWNQDAATAEIQLSVEERHSHRLENEEFGVDCQYEYEWRQGVVGQGGFGTVYKAKITSWNDNITDRAVVAVKETVVRVSTVRKWKQDGSLEKIKEYWRSLLELRHESLVAYHKVKITRLAEGTGVDFVMDYCEGGNLYDLIQDHYKEKIAFSAERLKHYAVQITSGLRYLHYQHILHGDLKPRNILLKRQPDGQHNAVIGDFDGSLRLEQGTMAGSREFKAIQWTVPYMSPEMVMMVIGRPDQPITYSTDIWSLGCVMLDLADCCCEVKERWYHNPAASHADESSINRIRKEDCVPFTFLEKLSRGYVPYISELVPAPLTNIINSCFIRDPLRRITTDLLLERLNALRIGVRVGRKVAK